MRKTFALLLLIGSLGAAPRRGAAVEVCAGEPAVVQSALPQSSDEFYIDLLMQLDGARPGQGYKALALGASERAKARNLTEALDSLAESTPWTLDEIRRQLDEDCLLLEYSLGERRSFLWAITPDSFTSHELPSKRRIEEEIRNLSALLSARNQAATPANARENRMKASQADAQLPAAARRLSQMLLGPVAEQLGAKRLIIVADGAIQYLPFAMLPGPMVELENAARNGAPPDGSVEAGKKFLFPPAVQNRPAASGDWLIVNHEIVNLPSMTALSFVRRELAARQSAPNDVAVLADPVFYSDDKRIRLISARAEAPASAIEASQDSDAASIIDQISRTQGGPSGKKSIPRLPFSQLEADRILAATPAGSTNLRAIGLLANRAAALSSHLAQYRYLHFSAPGLFDAEHPELSGLVLSMVDEEGEVQNGVLRAQDLVKLYLPAELVVLNGCRVSLGKEISADGFNNLTQSFMIAGGARIAASLWEVNDKAGVEIMSKFYRKILRENLTPAAALRAAQLEIMRQRQWIAPYYWAGILFEGEWR